MAPHNTDKIILLDTNAVIRYILNDVSEQHNKVKNCIRSKPVVVRYEVIAEAVYVFESVYNMQRADIADIMKKFLSTKNVRTQNPATIFVALTLFEKRKMDFVDCILCAFNTVNGYGVFTFDKEINKLLIGNVL